MVARHSSEIEELGIIPGSVSTYQNRVARCDNSVDVNIQSDLQILFAAVNEIIEPGRAEIIPYTPKLRIHAGSRADSRGRRPFGKRNIRPAVIVDLCRRRTPQFVTARLERCRETLVVVIVDRCVELQSRYCRQHVL